MSTLFNILMIIFNLIGLYFVIREIGMKFILFYTLLSNNLNMLSAIAFLIDPSKAMDLRYISVCMLVITFIITLFILVPAEGSGGFRAMFGTGLTFFHHLVCPFLSFFSYLLWEDHSNRWYLPFGITLVYTFILLYLNYKDKVDGPYPFFRIRKNGIKNTVITLAFLALFVLAVCVGITVIAD